MSDEWWGCLIDYPSFWPWAGRHRPCFGIGIYCFQSEPIPVIHLKGILVSCIKELWVELMLVYMPFKRYMIFICGMNGVLPQSVICPIVKYNGSSRSYPTLHEKRTTLWYGSMTIWMYGLHIYTWFVASNFEFLHKRIPTSTLSPDIV